ncbi:MAG: hypothetical protein WCS96_14760 [Victivallales bacterium]|jgi:hypothetical protein
MSKTNEKKKGVLAAIWESMTKTGGCCGGGESCGCVSRPDKDKTKNEKKNGDASRSRGTNSTK